MSSKTTSRTPWIFRFSLRFLLILMLASASYIGGWVSNEKRHEWLAERERSKPSATPPAPAFQAVRILPIKPKGPKEIFLESFDVPDGKLLDRMSDPNIVFPDTPRVE